MREREREREEREREREKERESEREGEILKDKCKIILKNRPTCMKPTFRIKIEMKAFDTRPKI